MHFGQTAVEDLRWCLPWGIDVIHAFKHFSSNSFHTGHIKTVNLDMMSDYHLKLLVMTFLDFFPFFRLTGTKVPNYGTIPKVWKYKTIAYYDLAVVMEKVWFRCKYGTTNFLNHCWHRWSTYIIPRLYFGTSSIKKSHQNCLWISREESNIEMGWKTSILAPLVHF